jgi:hypothetical protein
MDTIRRLEAELRRARDERESQRIKDVIKLRRIIEDERKARR